MSEKGHYEVRDGITRFFDCVLSIDSDAGELEALLARGGVDVNATGEDGYTALHCAAMADWDEEEDGRMKLLLDAGADKEARADTQAISSCTPLMLAADEGYAAQVRRLVIYGADVNATDAHGRTPLMLAAASTFQSVDKVRALLGAGAEALARDDDGWTALDHAKEQVSIWEGMDMGMLDRHCREREEDTEEVLQALCRAGMPASDAKRMRESDRLGAGTVRDEKLKTLREVIALLTAAMKTQ